jgi:DNA primase large subunit
MGSGDLAKYPFLNEAGEYLRDSGFGWDELESPDMTYIIDRAVERIEIAANGKVYDKIDRYEVEILTFLVSLILVRLIGIEAILRKFVLAEARRAERFITEDLKRQSEMQRRALFSKIFQDLFKLRIDIADDGRLFKVSVVDYITRSSHFHEQEWKLINRLVHDGYVHLDAEETVRLIRNELSVLIYDKIKAMSLPSLPHTITSRADKLRMKFASRYESGMTIVVKDYPPCIKHALEIMKRGENLPHSARVMLATYMLAIGKSVDEVVLMFENAPDFNERVTRYQVEHLAGIKGSGTKYSVPSCQKLRNENLCFAISECENLVNPVQFGRKRT